MSFCPKCGAKLSLKQCKNDGLVPYCEKCNEFVFPHFNVAVSMIVLNEDRTKTLFIQQYGKKRNILVAGYINKGESAEEAVKRELKEEVGLNAIKLQYQYSRYWEKSNTLLLNYVVIVASMLVVNNEEVDKYQWYNIDEAYDVVAEGGLAEYFYKRFYEGD